MLTAGIDGVKLCQLVASVNRDFLCRSGQSIEQINKNCNDTQNAATSSRGLLVLRVRYVAPDAAAAAIHASLINRQEQTDLAGVEWPSHGSVGYYAFTRRLLMQ